MKIKKGDKIIVIAGKDKGKTGTVLRVFSDSDAVLVEGVNLRKKHQRPTAKRQKGQIVERSVPIHCSNVSLMDPKSGKPTRVRIEKKDGARVRIAVKSGAKID